MDFSETDEREMIKYWPDKRLVQSGYIAKKLNGVYIVVKCAEQSEQN